MPGEHTIGAPTCSAVATVLAADGYPDSPRTGAEIEIPAELERDRHLHLFHAGTSLGAGTRPRVSGGRVLAVTGTGATVAEAAERSRRAAEAVIFEGRQFRQDIGWREIARQR